MKTEIEKFESTVNLAIEYAILTVLYGAIAAACCGAWWQLFWLVLIPLWAVMHRENYGKFRRGWLGWILEFLLIIRINSHGRLRVLRWSPIAWIVVVLTGLIVCIIAGIGRVCKMIKNDLITDKN
jgi:hypothetical protein